MLRSNSLSRRLLVQLTLVSLLLAALAHLSARSIAGQTMRLAHDPILHAAAQLIADNVRAGAQDVQVSIPASVFTMLQQLSKPLLYHVSVQGQTLVGLKDLPAAEKSGFTSLRYRGQTVRRYTLWDARRFGDDVKTLSIVVAQGEAVQRGIQARIGQIAALGSIGFMVIAALLSWLAARHAIRPITELADAVERRGPHRLTPIKDDAPIEIAPLLHALNHFLDRFSRSIRRTEAFISEAAHHIRTPLATLRMQADVLLSKTHNPEHAADLRRMLRSIDENNRISAQILEHAMIRYRSDRYKRSRIDLDALLERLVESQQTTAELADRRLQWLRLEPTSLYCDAVLIEVALRNLLDNALKYSRSWVGVSVWQDGNTAQVWIEDDGPGIGAQPLATLCQPFTRGEEQTGAIIGSGLGLAIVSEVASAHGGTLALHNIDSGGTRAALQLP